ncbi:MAG: ATP-binding protein [Candidatus Margulisiibacteriota bacterium]
MGGSLINIYSFVHIVSLVIYLLLLIYILANNFRSAINRSIAAILFCFVLWTFSLIFIHNPLVSQSTARIFYDIGVIGWASFGSFALYFVLLFTRNRRWLQSKLLRVTMIVWPLSIIYSQWKGWLAVDYIQRSWGWSYHWTDSPIFFSYYLSYLFFIGLVIYLLFSFSRRTNDKTQKGQALIIMSTSIVPLILGGITDVLLPKLNIHTVPNMAPDFVVIWAMGIVYAIVRYRFLAITPAVAADNIIAALPDPLLLLDEDQNIVFANGATFNLLGYSLKELQDKRIDVVFPLEQKEEQLANIASKERAGNYNLDLMAKDGRIIPAICSTSIIKRSIGGVVGTVCIMKDMTEARKIDIMKDEFVTNVSHELRTPLSIIKEGISIILEEIYGKIGKEQKELLSVSRQNVDRLSRLIDDLLDISKIEAHKVKLEIRKSNIGDIIKDVLSQLKSTARERRIKLSLGKLPRQPVFVLADKDKLDQIVINLISNSLKFTPRGGSIKVDIVVRENFAEVSVADTGKGIEEKDMPRLFSKFQQFGRKPGPGAKGTGLGLSISKGLVEMQGGRIWAESKPGAGSKFSFSIPLAKEE